MNGPGDSLLAEPARTKFPTTTWTVIVQTGANERESRHAFSELSQSYWYPLYAFARRMGRHHHDAEEALQAFFAWMLEADLCKRADPSRGRFRTYLIAAFIQFLSLQKRYANTAKRKPDGPILSLDATDAERRFSG